MKKLAIIGASYLQEPLVKKAKQMGIETHCFAWADGATCKDIADFFYPVSILEKEQILEKCKEIGIDGITSIASDAAVPTICYVAEHLNLISNSYSGALIATNKFLMRQRFTEYNVSSPLFAIAQDGFAGDNFRFPVIVKPTDRSGSRGVMKVEKKEDLLSAIERAKQEAFSKQAIVEEFVTGWEISVETISWKGKHYILTLTDKVTTGEPYFVELEHHQPSQLSAEIQQKVRAEVTKALDALEVHYGASHTELKITDSGEVFMIEVGARMGGDFIGSDLTQLSTGYDFVKGVIDVALGTFEEPSFAEPKYSGVYFLCKETENVLSMIKNAAQYKEIVASEITDENLRNIQNSADRSGYFIYQSDKKMTI
jgi:biotin carboxylase